MRPITVTLALVPALALGLGCGEKERLSADDGQPAPTVPVVPRSGGQPTPPAVVKPRTVDRLVEGVPVETFLVGGLQVPDLLKLQDLTLSFRSNVEGATFECRAGASRDFVACGGDTFSFKSMANGSAQALEVRARSPLGELDGSPLAIAFVVDLERGGVPSPRTRQAAVAALPSTAQELVAARSLQLGSSFAVAVPGGAGLHVASYSTDKTYNGRLETMRLMSIYPAACLKGYERTTTIDTGELYCEATPTRAELVTDNAKPLPRNHLEVVKLEGDTVNVAERLVLAAFDADADQAETHVGIEESCRGAAGSGQTRVANMVREFSGAAGAGAIFWCQTQDRNGGWWWFASFAYESAGGKARVKGIYAASAKLGIFSGQDMVARTSALVRDVVVPVAP